MDGHQANGAFVAVGPPGFTALALIKLGENAAEMYVAARFHCERQTLIPDIGHYAYA